MLAGYARRHYGAIMSARDTVCPARKINHVLVFYCVHVMYNKSFIDQACSVKMAGYWPRFFVFMDVNTLSWSINMQKKKELGQYPTILTSCLVNSPYMILMYLSASLLSLTVLHFAISCNSYRPLYPQFNTYWYYFVSGTVQP